MLLQNLGLTGLTYKQINVVIFCFVWPILTLYLILTVLKQRDQIKKFKAKQDKNDIESIKNMKTHQIQTRKIILYKNKVDVRLDKEPSTKN